jgi:hypothetical protein
MQKKDASSVMPMATNHAQKKITSLFLLSAVVLSRSTLNAAPIAPPQARAWWW